MAALIAMETAEQSTPLAASAELFGRACKVMPGGVSSPVRAFGSVGGTPLCFRRASGTRVTTEDDRDYLDFIGSWGPLILGHAHPAVVEAVQKAAACGTSFGAPCKDEILLAEKIVALSPVAEKVRFVNSGTEATMSALRLARAATGRDWAVKFDGCYHGHADSFLVRAGSGLATTGESSSAGVPQATSDLTGILPLDDESALEEWFAAHGNKTAAVFLEGIPANCGLLVQRPEWLAKLRDLTRQHGTLLIVDEVITGFRLGAGGFCGREGYEADLVTYGKVIGGGLPVGAYAGPSKWMDLVSPKGGVYQAGTLSGNPLGMAAGLAALNALESQNGWQRLEDLGAYWEGLMRPLLEREIALGHPVSMVREGSIYWFCFDREVAPRSFADIPESGAARYGKVFHALMERGVLIAPSAYEVGFLNLAMTEADLDLAAQAWSEALKISR
jgi:glutamate-1-semialdehyde 2,1-aminomutase